MKLLLLVQWVPEVRNWAHFQSTEYQRIFAGLGHRSDTRHRSCKWQHLFQLKYGHLMGNQVFHTRVQLQNFQLFKYFQSNYKNTINLCGRKVPTRRLPVNYGTQCPQKVHQSFAYHRSLRRWKGTTFLRKICVTNFAVSSTPNHRSVKMALYKRNF